VPYFSLALLPSPAATAFVEGPRASSGQVTVVGLGPGDPRWLTPEARAALAGADDLIGYLPYLERVAAGPHQRLHPSDNRVEAERAAFALDLAKRGRRVTVVSSGDPGVFAMAAAVLEVSEDPQFKDVPVRVVPGLTAAQAVASRVGAPLGHDFCVVSLSDRLKPWSVIEKRLRAIAEADLILAIYNPASRTRPDQIKLARDILLEHRRADTVVVVGRDVGRAEEALTVTTLGSLDTDIVDMKSLVLVGASSTRVTASGRVWTPRWVR
jgi:precorrin-2 C20-methyltransferase/precorrin-3B C17-methyltransferase